MKIQSPNKLTIARKIWQLLTPSERKHAVTLLLLTFVGVALETLGVGLVIPALALFMQSDIGARYPMLQPALGALGNPSRQSLIVGGMLALVGVYLVKNLFLGFLAWRQQSFTFDSMEQMSQRILSLYLHQPYVFHLRRNSAELIRNAIGEVSLFTSNVITPVVQLLAEVLVIMGIAVLLLSIEPEGAMIVASVIGIASWFYNRVTHSHIVRWGGLRQYHSGQMLQHMQQGLGGAKDIKLLGRETEFIAQYSFHNKEYARAGKLQNTLLQLPRLWLELLAVGGLAALVLTMLAQGRAPEFIVPTLGLFAAAAFRLLPSVNRVLGATQALKFGLPVIDTLHAELSLPMPATAMHAPHPPFQRTLDLYHIAYAYPSAADKALDDITLTIVRGESIGFIGSSGAGKSTLVDVLLGLLTPDAGEVRVDGRNIQLSPRRWQDQIGYVPQSIYLTDDTLRRNVAFGLPNGQIDDTAVWRAVRASQLEQFVNDLPQGLDTMVGERGIRISGGQRQRIGIARALYHDPPVLVLDEATSSLDTATERNVMETVRALHGAKTLIIVAHRLSTVEHCDRLFRLEQGRVVEEGKTGVVLGKVVGPPAFPAHFPAPKP